LQHEPWMNVQMLTKSQLKTCVVRARKTQLASWKRKDNNISTILQPIPKHIKFMA